MCFNEGWCLPPAPWAEGGEGREISARNREGGEGDTWKGREQWCGDRRGRGPPQTRVAAPWEGSELLGDVLVDPVQVLGDTGVDAGPVGLGAAVPPADHTCLQPGAVDLADQGPSRVTLGRRGVSSGWRGWGGWGLWGGQGPPGRSPFSCSRHTSCRHGRSGRCPPCTGQCGTPSHTGCFPRWGPSPAAAGMAVAGVLRVSGEAITVLGQLLGPLPQWEPQSWVMGVSSPHSPKPSSCPQHSPLLFRLPQPVTQHDVPGGKVSDAGGRVTSWTWLEMLTGSWSSSRAMSAPFSAV